MIRAAALLMLALVTGCGEPTAKDTPEKSQPVNSVADLRSKLAKLKYQRDRLDLARKRLQVERGEIRQRLESLGVTSTDDLASHADWKLHARELRDVLDRTQKIKANIEKHDAAVVRLESLLRRHERDQETASARLTEEELNDLAAVLYEVESELSSSAEIPVVEELELEELMRNELKHQRKTP